MATVLMTAFLSPPFLSSTSQMTVDAFIDGIIARGHGTSLAKFDVARAYRNVGVHPLDRPLLGMKWRDKYYVDMALPFGLRSAPCIFTAIAHAVQWMLTSHHGVDFLWHYLDDFLTQGPPASSVCYNNLQACIQLCSKLGLPLHPDKLEGPSTCLSILGIELDSIRLQARLPTDKRERIVTLLKSWSGKRFCRRRELESLISHLHHACKIAPQGRTFLRRILLCTFRRDDHPIRLNQEFHLDLTWWHELFHRWDGLSFFLMPEWAPLPDFQVSSDAAGTLGYVAIFQRQCSAVHGQHVSNPCLLRTRSSFPLLWLYTCGVLNGLLGRSSSCATMSRWWLFCLLAPLETPN